MQDASLETVPPSRRPYLLAACLLGLIGASLRLVELASYAFWLDEAWVALSTRAIDLAQWWLSLCITPVLWAIALKGLSFLPIPPEASLRALPFAFGVATLPAAYILGHRLAGHELGGLLALGAVALDPSSIAFSKMLKQYSAEAFFALLSFLALARALDARDLLSLLWLAAVLVIGVGFANSQVLVAPPLLAVLLFDASSGRDARHRRRTLVAAAAIGALIAIEYFFVLAPRLGPGLQQYWAKQLGVPVGSLRASSMFAIHALSSTFAPGLGGVGAAVGTVALIAAAVRDRVVRLIALALAWLTAELVGLGVAGRFPLGVERLMLFYTTAFLVIAVAGMARLARPWTDRLSPARNAAIAVAILIVLAAPRDWRLIAQPRVVEDAGPLVRLVETTRAKDEPILLNNLAFFAFAFYEAPPPALIPAPAGVGFWPLPVDPGVQALDVAAARRALRSGRRIWFLGSHLSEEERERVRSELVALGSVQVEERRPGAILLRIAPDA